MADLLPTHDERDGLPTDLHLDRLQWTTLLYDLHETNPDNGLVRDKTDPAAPCSIAAVGMALATLPVVIERGVLLRPFAAKVARRRLRFLHELPQGPAFPADATGIATRDASGKVLNAIGKNVPWVMGGSADLAPSCKTRLTFDGAGDFFAESPSGRNLHFGIREHAMAAVLNGMALVKVRAYGSCFLIFSDYARGAMRLSALMELPVVYVFTHDSIGVGEDGPTHQPVEQLASLRAIPGLIVLRPADADEVAEAWKVIMKLHHEPASTGRFASCLFQPSMGGEGQVSLCETRGKRQREFDFW